MTLLRVEHVSVRFGGVVAVPDDPRRPRGFARRSAARLTR